MRLLGLGLGVAGSAIGVGGAKCIAPCLFGLGLLVARHIRGADGITARLLGLRLLIVARLFNLCLFNHCLLSLGLLRFGLLGLALCRLELSRFVRQRPARVAIGRDGVGGFAGALLGKLLLAVAAGALNDIVWDVSARIVGRRTGGDRWAVAANHEPPAATIVSIEIGMSVEIV
jgi:hypothetical protein